MKSPLSNFLFGGVLGTAIATLTVIHVMTTQIEARNAQVTASLAASQNAVQAQAQQESALAQKVIDAWRSRAEGCEAKFSMATVIYQNQPVASVPFLRGMVALQVAPGAGATTPAMVIPAQVDVYSLRPDVRYQWLDNRTGQPQSVILPAKTAIQ